MLQYTEQQIYPISAGQPRRFCIITHPRVKRADLALTGDASDELLGGYSFTWRADDPVWSEKRAQMCSTWTFCAPTLAEALRGPLSLQIQMHAVQ